MKSIIAELDKIAKYLEDMEEPWAYNLSYRIDNVTQKIEETHNKSISKTSSNISRNVLEQYREDLEFLSNKESSLKELIMSQNTKDASKVYKSIKAHFGKLNRKESIRFIKNIINSKDN